MLVLIRARPRTDALFASTCRFTTQRLGAHAIEKLWSSINEYAGLPKPAGANHTLRRSLVTTGYQAGVPDKDLQNITRHKSSSSLDMYKK